MSALGINYQPMTTIKLYGQLRQFGRSFRLAVRSPAEAIKALCVQIPGFERFISSAKSRGVEFAIFRGSKNIDENELSFGGSGEIRIAPVITGSKRAGLLQTIVGVVLIAAPFIEAGVFEISAVHYDPSRFAHIDTGARLETLKNLPSGGFFRFSVPSESCPFFWNVAHNCSALPMPLGV
ncbi:hypothetical protein [Pseudomonas frederiksbergensis]|uniref:Tail assembly protein n=1 Tax=Pseudomonas frederiksbergensis TaxID=104087 RepID=A0A6L5C437_9PSED|nr:hypothetical protein [Pseudomonas frederiksbergensis]KAF2395373.1 hypothetical protein FX983_03357 [Pseudomonas frederiksbergensis]